MDKYVVVYTHTHTHTHIYTMKYYSEIKRNKFESVIMRWVALQANSLPLSYLGSLGLAYTYFCCC